MQIYFRPNGAAQCVYDEKIDLTQLGKLDIKRASHVEPDPDYPGCWYVDLSPVGGPRINGFASRGDALAAEVTWLEHHMNRRHLHVQSTSRE